MRLSSKYSARRSRNAEALRAFGAAGVTTEGNSLHRVLREGGSATVYTIGYERRSGDDLIAALRNACVKVLVDIRERAMSRRADFRGEALKARCKDAGIKYVHMPRLGSTSSQRDDLRETGDIEGFRRKFRKFAKCYRSCEIEELAKLIGRQSAALLCYERLHDECHRSVVADLAAEVADATVVAIA
jgi:uncharacterized protein (DUF488 family)